MIQIEINYNQIKVKGHADKSKDKGRIVCAAISALTQALSEGLDQRSMVTSLHSIQPGYAVIAWDGEDESSLALIGTYIDCVKGIAEENPEFITITQ